MQNKTKSDRSPGQIIGDIEKTRALLATAKKWYHTASKAVLYGGAGANNEAFEYLTDVRAYEKELAALEAELSQVTEL